MKSVYFFRISWLVQLVVGICLFVVSFLIEQQVLSAFISSSYLALLLAGSLELGKAVAIIWHRYMSYQTNNYYPLSVRLASSTFRIGLVALSVICSLLFLANNLDRPNLDKVRSAEMSHDKTRLQASLQRFDKEKKERLLILETSQNEEYQNMKKGFDQRISTLQAELKKEMGNVVNGTFEGPRYAAIQSRLSAEKQQANSALAKLGRNNKKTYLHEQNRIQSALEVKREKAYEQADNDRDELIKDDFANDERANDSRIVAFLKLLQSVFDINVLPLQFVFIFSLLISILMEIGILLAFNTITISILPALKATHDADLSNEILHTEIDKEARKDELRHKEAINKIRNTADNVMDKAREYMNVRKHT